MDAVIIYLYSITTISCTSNDNGAVTTSELLPGLPLLLLPPPTQTPHATLSVLCDANFLYIQTSIVRLPPVPAAAPHSVPPQQKRLP